MLHPFIRTFALGRGPRRCAGAFALMVIAALVGRPAAGEPARLDPDTGAATWEVQVHGVTFSLT
jgi:hypothetical protein